MKTGRVSGAITLISAFLIIGTSPIRGQGIPRFMEGFGDARWGLSRDEVKAVFEQSHQVDIAHSAWDYGSYSEWSYVDTAAEAPYRVFPEFVYDSLYSVMLAFEVNNMDAGDIAYAFRQLEVVLADDYSLPDKVTVQHEPVGKSIDHAWLSVWDKYETEISLILVNVSESVYALGISYVCKDLESLYDPAGTTANKIKLGRTANTLGVTALSIMSAEKLMMLLPDINASSDDPRPEVETPPKEPNPEADEFVAVQQMPVEIHHEAPAYPEKAAGTGKSAVVWIQALVGGDGRVQDARVLKSSGNALGFDEAALEAAYKNRYRPAIQNGQPVPVWVSFKVEFKAPKK